MKKYLIPALALPVLLAGCATAPTASQWSTTVNSAQLLWPIAKAAINADVKNPPAALLKAEVAITDDLAVLAKSPVPTTTVAAIDDVDALVAALPASVLSTAHQQEVTLFVDAIKIALGAAG